MNFSRSLFLILCLVFVSSAYAEDNGLFKLETTLAKKNFKLGETAILYIKLTAIEPTKINREAPLTLEIKPSASLTFEKLKLSKNDAKKNDTHEMSWEMPVRTLKAGNHPIEGILNFYLCTSKWCKKFEGYFKNKLDVNL